MAAKYRKRPVEVAAIQYLPPTNCEAVWKFLGWEWPEGHDNCGPDVPCFIPTLEGEMEASAGDWIVRGAKGEFYPVKPDIFEATYEAVGE